jgi:hypothetical protein
VRSTCGLWQPVQHQKKKAVAREKRDEDAEGWLGRQVCEPKTLTGSCAVGACVRERRGPSRAGLVQRSAATVLGLSRQHNSRQAVDLSPGRISGPRSGQEAREKRCRRVLAAVEDQNSHLCDLDPARLGWLEWKGKRSALTPVPALTGDFC